MTYLIDTNVCIDYLNGRSIRVRQRMEALSPSEVVLCSVVKAELFYGAMKSANPPLTLAWQEPFITQFLSLPFDDAAAEQYGRLRAFLAKQGLSICPNDLLIAATALANKVTLVTHNISEFERVPGLKMQDWQA